MSFLRSKKEMLFLIDEQIRKVEKQIKEDDNSQEYFYLKEGTCTYKIINSIEALELFKKGISKHFSSSKPKLKYPSYSSCKATGKRIDKEGIQYCNEYSQRSEIFGKDDENQWSGDTVSGFFTNGYIALYTGKIGKMEDSPYGDFDGKFISVEIRHECKLAKDKTPLAVITDGENHLFCQARYVDIVLTKYPSAKPFVSGELKETSPVGFVHNEKVVGFIMPFLPGKDYLDNF